MLWPTSPIGTAEADKGFFVYRLHEGNTFVHIPSVAAALYLIGSANAAQAFDVASYALRGFSNFQELSQALTAGDMASKQWSYHPDELAVRLRLALEMVVSESLKPPDGTHSSSLRSSSRLSARYQGSSIFSSANLGRMLDRLRIARSAIRPEFALLPHEEVQLRLANNSSSSRVLHVLAAAICHRDKLLSNASSVTSAMGSGLSKRAATVSTTIQS